MILICPCLQSTPRTDSVLLPRLRGMACYQGIVTCLGCGTWAGVPTSSPQAWEGSTASQAEMGMLSSSPDVSPR